jgi:fatty-acid desaturase
MPNQVRFSPVVLRSFLTDYIQTIRLAIELVATIVVARCTAYMTMVMLSVPVYFFRLFSSHQLEAFKLWKAGVHVLLWPGSTPAGDWSRWREM